MAGLFEAWRPAEDADWLLSCCIVTTAANALMAPIHDRMPVMLERAQWDAWLDRRRQDPAEIAPLLAPSAAETMRAWPVSKAVNRAGNDGPALIEPSARTD